MPGPHIELAIYDSEEQLLAALRRHEPDACACLIKRFASLVYAQTLRLLGDHDDAEGALQTTFVQACTQFDSYQGRGGLGTWLYRIATNEALMQIRRRRPQVSLDDVASSIRAADLSHQGHQQPTDPADLALDKELWSQLDAALATLPENQRVVFVLRQMYGLSTEQTAEALGIEGNAVKVRLHRARARLREQLASYLEAADR